MASRYWSTLNFVTWVQRTYSSFICLTVLCSFYLVMLSNSFTKICAVFISLVWYLKYTSNSIQDIVGCVLCLTSLIWWSLLHICYKHSAYLCFGLSAPQFDHSSHNSPTSFSTSSLPLQHFVLILSDIASFRLFLIILLGRMFPGLKPCVHICDVSVQKWWLSYPISPFLLHWSRFYELPFDSGSCPLESKAKHKKNRYITFLLLLLFGFFFLLLKCPVLLEK